MKKKFLSIAKNNNVQILSYNSERSDMNVQMFEMELKLPYGKTVTHIDSYFVGESEGREKVLSYFEEYLQSLTN